MQKTSIEFEKAVRLLAQHMPVSEQNSRKPIMAHDIRVGNYLYEKGYAQDIVVAGVLHDAIEWSDVDEQMLRKEFGDNVAQLVLACTKDDTIVDKEEKVSELIKRCVRCGQDALIVKTADIIDSFAWYTSQNNKEELQYCQRNAEAIFKYKPANFEDKIFAELKEWQKKTSTV